MTPEAGRVQFDAPKYLTVRCIILLRTASVSSSLARRNGFCLAVAAAIAVKVPALFGMDLDDDAEFYART
jgi:hypothetical protein